MRGGQIGLFAEDANTHLVAAGVTIEGCTGCGVLARYNATVALRGCLLRQNGEDCKTSEVNGGKIVREDGQVRTNERGQIGPLKNITNTL